MYIIFTLSLTIPFIIGLINLSEGRSFFNWFLYGLFLPPFAMVHTLFLSFTKKTEPKIRDKNLMECPYCFEEIRKDSKVCPHCLSKLVKNEL